MKRALGVFTGAVFLVACGCTDIGCLSYVEISLASLVEWSGTESFTVELCVDDHCDSQTIDPERAEQLWTNNRGQVSFDMIPNDVDTGQVSVGISTDNDTLQTESSGINFESDRPNGPFCDPVCHFASVTVEDGHLANQ